VFSGIPSLFFSGSVEDGGEEEARIFSGGVSWRVSGIVEVGGGGEEGEILSVFGGSGVFPCFFIEEDGWERREKRVSDLSSGCFLILNREWKYLRGCGRMGRRKRKN